MPKNIFVYLIALISLTTVLTGCESSRFLERMSQTPVSSAPAPTRAQLEDNAFWQADARTIWSRLQQLPVTQLEAITTSDPIRTGWIKLAVISKRYSKDTQALIQQIKTWRQEYPSHPANALLPGDAAFSSILSASQPTKIGLLLPLQGPKGASGQAVRDGFLQAYYASLGKTHTQQSISFYDTSQTANVSALYQKALNEGADLIVGPLIKEEVDSLISGSRFSVPTLALNYTDSSLPANLYEFGLSPLDESQQIADKAWRDGHSRAIVIAPSNAWGQRVSRNLISRFQSAGGQVTETFYYSSQTDFTQAIAALLHVNPNADQNSKNKVTNKTILEKRRRQDFDVIFLLAQPQEGRAIVPLLRYYYADNIPIYSTSVIYAGVPNPQKDTDLNGITFVDAPSIIGGGTSRLHAVGSDAYFISNELVRLTKLPEFPLYGETGALTLDSNHQIHRRLPWTTFQHGHP